MTIKELNDNVQKYQSRCLVAAAILVISLLIIEVLSFDGLVSPSLAFSIAFEGDEMIKTTEYGQLYELSVNSVIVFFINIIFAISVPFTIVYAVKWYKNREEFLTRTGD